MNTPKHTPGPWKADFVTTDLGLVKCQILGSIRGPVGAQSALVVADLATVGIAGMKGPGAFDLQSQANAFLIAAAPDLLEACKGLLPYAHKLRDASNAIDGLVESRIGLDYDIDIAQAAIDKAVGGDQ